MQRRVGKELSVNAAGLVRYLYGLPFALLFVILYETLLAHGAFPAFTHTYWLLCIVGGIG